MASASTLGKMSPQLLKVVERAKREPEGRFHSLAHLPVGRINLSKGKSARYRRGDERSMAGWRSAEGCVGARIWELRSTSGTIRSLPGGGGRRVTIPARSNATTSPRAGSEATQRDVHVRFIDQHGRPAWECHVGFGRRLVVENAMYRCKTIIGRRMRARGHGAQKTEADIGCKILNRMSQLGLPQGRVSA